MITVTEMVESLNGFDEIAIEKHWGKSLDDLNGTTLARSLVFVLKRREGMKDIDAKQSAMEMTLKQVNEAFAREEDEVTPDEPTTDQGKGGGSESMPLNNSLPSAS